MSLIAKPFFAGDTADSRALGVCVFELRLEWHGLARVVDLKP